MKRLLNCEASDFKTMNGKTLKQSILASEGRVVCSETVVSCQPYDSRMTNAEIAKSFGADLLLLNTFDCLMPKINGLNIQTDNPVETLKKLVGRPIGVNLEPIDTDADMLEDKLQLAEGRRVNPSSLKAAEKLGIDFICLTGNPGTGVTNKAIAQAIQLTKKHFSGLIIAGKMHGAGVAENVVADKQTLALFIESGADVILVPAVGTIPGFNSQELAEAVKFIKSKGALVMSAIGTSQESASKKVIEEFAIANKIAGVDIQHIGDAGVSGIAPPENIFALSKAIRGLRHTISMISRSVYR